MNTEQLHIQDEQSSEFSFPDVTPRREGGDDALAESSPTDSRLDEKVIINNPERTEEKAGQRQTAVQNSEGHGAGDKNSDDRKTNR